MFRHANGAGGQSEGAHEQAPRLGEEMEGTAEKRHGPADGLAAGQAPDGLIDHCLQDACRNVLASGAFIDERLHVRLRKHPAASGNGIDRRAFPRELVQSHRVG